MGKFSKRKGYRIENQLVNKIKSYGIECRRQPMSGAIPDFPFDIQIQEPRMSIEVKARANGEGFKTLEKWKGSADLLCLHRNNADTMVLLNFNLFLDILSEAKKKEPYNPPFNYGGYDSNIYKKDNNEKD